MSLQRLPNFCKQSASLFGLTILDSAEGTNNENVEHTTFYVENVVPNWGKKPRPTTCRIFTQITKWEKTLQSNSHCYKVTHTHPTTLGHTYLVFPGQVTQRNVLVPLDLDTLNSLITREMKNTLLSCFYSQANVRYNEVQICQYWKLFNTLTKVRFSSQLKLTLLAKTDDQNFCEFFS